MRVFWYVVDIYIGFVYGIAFRHQIDLRIELQIHQKSGRPPDNIRSGGIFPQGHIQ